jgi:hypothetical protein
VNETDMVLLPESLKALKRVAKEVGLDLRGAYLNLDGGFDSAHNRQCIFNAGLIPNITENPRNRKTTKRGRNGLHVDQSAQVLRYLNLQPVNTQVVEWEVSGGGSPLYRRSQN